MSFQQNYPINESHGISSQSDKTPYLLLGGATLSFFAYFLHADYNLPIYIFTYLIWTHPHIRVEEVKKNQVRFCYLIAFTFIIDFISLIYWGSKYSNFVEEGSPLSWMSSVVKYTGIINLIQLIYKIGLLGYINMTFQHVQDSFSPEIMAEDFVSTLSVIQGKHVNNQHFN